MSRHRNRSTLEYALTYLAGGISIIPIRRDGTKKPPLNAWKPFMGEPVDQATARKWWAVANPPGIAAIGGAVSGGLECIDFDTEADTIFPAWREMVEEQAPGLLDRLTVVQTPRQPSGYHVWLRCRDIDTPGNTKLAGLSEAEAAIEKAAAKVAGRKAELTLIETRGEGGYALIPGSPPECHPTNRPYVHTAGPALDQLGPVSMDERELLITCAGYFDRADQAEPVKAKAFAPGEGLLPGDDFEQRATWAEVLEPHGWVLEMTVGEEGRWRRPGKEKGWGATTGYCKSSKGEPLFKCHTTSGQPFETGPPYGKFRAYALLNHGSADSEGCAKAADDLRRKGYGDQANRKAKAANGKKHEHNGTASPSGNGQEGHSPDLPDSPDPSWGELIPLGDMLQAPAFPTEVLPECLQTLVREGADALNGPADYFGVPLLVVASAAMGNSRVLAITGSHLVWSVYLPERIREVALDGESRGRSFGQVRLDLLLQIDPFALVPELVTS